MNNYRVTPQSINARYLSVAPRATVFSGTIHTASKDPATNGIYRFTYFNDTGNMSDTVAHMSIDIGTTAGARDLGTFRIRKPVDATYVYIEEVSEQESGIQNGRFFTIKREWRPVSIKPRLVEKSINTDFANDFTEFHDYDIPYSIQNQQIKPKANITESGNYANGTLIQVKPAGFVDEGETYRTVILSSSNSEAFNVGGSITSRSWDVRDGTISVGTSTSTDIEVEFPVGFRWISLTVTANNGITDTMYLPIWVHDENNMPVTQFSVTSDQSEEWRDVSFLLWGNNNQFPEATFPEGAALCYWKDAYFAGNPVPDDYISQALLYSKQETETLRLYEPEMALEASGTGYWLSQYKTYAQSLLNANAPSRWHEIVSLNSRRAIHYFLREYSVAPLVSNLFLKMTTAPIEKDDIPANDIWSQLKYLADGDEFRKVRTDSLGGIWVTKHADYMNASERSSWIVRCAIDTQDIAGENPISYPNEFVQKVAISKGNGSAFSGGVSTLYMAQAPGKAEGYALGGDEAPFLRLDVSNPQSQLNQLIGDWWASQNKRQQSFDIELYWNADMVEPAYGEIIELSYLNDSLKGTQLIGEPFTVSRVSRVTNDDFDVVTWTISPVTDGENGDFVPVPPPQEWSADEWNFPVEAIFPDAPIPPPFNWGAPPSFPPPIPPPTPNNPEPEFHAAFITSDKKVFKTENMANASPSWTNITLTMDGTIVQALADPFSPFFTDNTQPLNIVVVTTEKIYTVDDLYDATPTVTTRYTFAEASPLRSLSISSAFPKNACVVSNYEDRTEITSSTDLLNWTAEAQFGSTGIGFCFDFSGGTNIVVNATDYYSGETDTAFALTAGQEVIFEQTSGQWRRCWFSGGVQCDGWVSADGYEVAAASNYRVPGASGGIDAALIGRLGGGGWVHLGKEGSFTATHTGNLHLAMNNVDNPTSYAYGQGSVTITIKTSSPCVLGSIPSTENSPGAYSSVKQSGKLYTTGATTGAGYTSIDNGATMTLTADQTPPILIASTERLAGEIGIPEKNTPAEIIGFYGKTAGKNRQTMRIAGIFETDISPSVGNITYGPYKTGNTISCHPTQTGRVIVCGMNYARSRVGVWETENNGGDWIVVQAPVNDSASTGRYERATYASGSSTVMYLWGTKGKIGYAIKIAGAWDVASKVGNINQSTTGEIINVFIKGAA